MTVADILTFVGIVVSIIFGFFITHFYSIRDARTRVLKDYYIEQVKNIKGRVDQFFHSIAFGKSSFRKTIDWFDHFTLDAEGLDQGVRKVLDLQIEEINDIFDKYQWEITSWEDFNNQSLKSQYKPINIHRQKLLQMKQMSDEFLNSYVNHINQANLYPIWKVLYRRIKLNYNYYKQKGYKLPLLYSIYERIEKHFWEVLGITGLLILSIYLISERKIEEKEDFITPLNNISNKQDSIFKEIQLFRNKYKPVEMNSKTFNNSSFFSAEKVDSVHIKVYQKDQQDN